MLHKIYNRIVDTGAVEYLMRSGAFSLLVINIVGGVFFFTKRKRNEELEAEEDFKNSLICRFVLDGVGRKVGESVAVDENVLIIKSGTKYLGVPIKHIEEDGKTLLVKGLIEKDKAEIMGEKWRRESFSKIVCDEGEEDGI
jgi:hypothetical protein